RPRSVVDQHPLGAIRCQSLQTEPGRVLSGRTARGGGHDPQTDNGTIIHGPILRPNHHQHIADPRVPRAPGDSMTQHAATPEGEVLLGYGAAEPSAPTGRNDERIYGSHARVLSHDPQSRHHPEGGVPLQYDNYYHAILSD